MLGSLWLGYSLQLVLIKKISPLKSIQDSEGRQYFMTDFSAIWSNRHFIYWWCETVYCYGQHYLWCQMHKDILHLFHPWSLWLGGNTNKQIWHRAGITQCGTQGTSQVREYSHPPRRIVTVTIYARLFIPFEAIDTKLHCIPLGFNSSCTILSFIAVATYKSS